MLFHVNISQLQAAANAMTGQGGFLQVPLPLSPVGQGHALTGKRAPVHFIGICAAASSVGRRISSQVLKCPSCDTVQTVLVGVPRHACCEESDGLSCAQWEEDMAGRTFVPVFLPQKA